MQLQLANVLPWLLYPLNILSNFNFSLGLLSNNNVTTYLRLSSHPTQNLLGTPHYRTYFYIGGSYVPDPFSNSSIAHGQIYVEHLIPYAGVTKKRPLLMIHGAGMTGSNFLNTPDGRPGWADWFLGQGYEVYLIDQPSRGRSPWQQHTDGPQATFSTSTVESLFTSPERYGLWPNASLHMQWPGNGSVGDPVFDVFYASMVPLLVTNVESATKNQEALVALVDKIGPINLLTHSQSGLFGWSLADARPALIKSITALEPGGPPFTGDVLSPSTPSRAWGLTDIPITYSPPITSPASLSRVITNDPAKDGYTCYQQSPNPNPPGPRKLVNLENIPVLVVTSHTSWHGISDGCMVDFMNQAGVSGGAVEWVRLQDVGIEGNGHMFFMEKNSEEIVEKVVGPWVARNEG